MNPRPRDTETPFRTPPESRTPGGEVRRVGFELELSGLELRQLADEVARVWGGAVETENPYRHRIVGADAGEVTVELDWNLLSEAKLQQRLDDLDPGQDFRELAALLEEKVADLAQTVVPLEVITPPLPIDRLEILDVLRGRLLELGAVGTGGSLAYAFGLHLNPEAPSFEGESILRHLRAFLLLYDWLCEEQEIDFTRRVVPFINSFPKDYVKRVMAAGYEPTRERLIDDYLEDNPTRNRPLDLLPLFAHVDPDRIFDQLDDDLIKARPTYHYRLPNCRIDDPEWRIAEEWNLWLRVEELAADRARLAEMVPAYREFLDAPLSFLSGPWRERVEKEWL
jgi:hypothetical protein